MIVVRDFDSANRIINPAIRELVQHRIQALSEQGCAIEDVGHFVVVDAFDTLASIEQHIGMPLTFCELIDPLPCCMDMVFVLDQAGKGIEVFVPFEDGIDTELIAMCQNLVLRTPPGESP